MAYILGIETSCDETAAAIVEDGRKVCSNVVASQIAKHAPYGGVVPELAAREHLKAIEYVVNEAIKSADITLDDVSAISVTNGPGLLPALLVGLNFARGMAFSHNIQLIGINHFIAHIYGTFLDMGPELLEQEDTYPLLALVVSGGHTNLVLIDETGKTEVIGQTLDDAAGEAFDKGAKLMNLGYPGGPVVEKVAKDGDPAKFPFPRPLTGRSGSPTKAQNRFNFSFSGVKTALLYHCEDHGGGEAIEGQLLHDTVASYQEAIVDVLAIKTFDAVKQYNVKSLVLCGGVACNNPLRERFEQKSEKAKVNLYLSPKKYCTDNASMVAGLAWHYYKHDKFDDYDLDAYSRLPHLSQVPFC